MSFETLTTFEEIRTRMMEQKALMVLFIDAFATQTDPKTIAQDILLQKDTFLNAAALLADLSYQICKEMDAAIDAAGKEVLPA